MLVSQGVMEVNAQPNVFHRSDAGTNIWWHESNRPWFRDAGAVNIDRPDRLPDNTVGRTFVHIGHNTHPIMVVNGAWFQLKSLRLQHTASVNRTFNESEGGGISIDTGIFNESPGTHTFNVPIGVDALSVVFDAAHSSGSMVFNRTILLNANTAIFRGPGNISVSGDMTGTGNIIKEGTGALTLTGANTFSGLTTVRAGVLELNRTGGNTLNAGDSVVVEGGTLRIRTPQTLSSLTVGATGNVVVETGGSLIVSGNLTVTGTLTNHAGYGGLVLLSGASMLHDIAAVPATMQRFFSSARLWRLVSSPVANQAISGPWTPTTPGYDFYAWYENGAIWRNQKVTTNHITHFEPGKGYLVSFEGANLTQSFAGLLNNGDVSEPVRRTHNGIYAGANLLGNPYPSSIDWHLATRTLFADNFAYVYDRVSSHAGITEGYRPVDGSVAGALIAPNQGFFVIKSAQGTANFTFTNAMRAHGGVFKSAPAAQRISLTLSHGGWFDQAEITLQPEATPLRETSDALKFFSYNENMPQIYTTSSDGMRLAINSVGQITQESSFNIGIRANATGQYIMQIEGLEGEFMGLPAFIRDLTTGELHNLRENPRVSFHATKGEPVDRFILTFTQPTNVDNLPVDATLVYFAHGMLHMQFPTEESNRMLHVIDLTGRVVLSKSLHGMGNVVSVPLQLVNGAYIVRITGETSITSRRIWVK